MFRPLSDLHALKLCYNQLKTIKFDTFDNIASLQELDLTGNDMETVPTPALLGIPGLRKLILRHNRLTKIDAYAFNHLPIEVLDLGDNGAPLEIHEEAFCGLQPTVLRSEPGVIDWSGEKV
jgi:Leucine-rich repeat (LRR) protein